MLYIEAYKKIISVQRKIKPQKKKDFQKNREIFQYLSKKNVVVFSVYEIIRISDIIKGKILGKRGRGRTNKLKRHMERAASDMTEWL